MTEDFQKTVSIKAVDEDDRTATGAVLVPDELDHQADFFRPDAIERFHSEDPDTGVMHSAFPDDAAKFERLEIIDEPETIGGEEFRPGTLVGERRYQDDDLWQLVSDGILTGFSIGGDIEEAVEHDALPGDIRVPDAVERDSDAPVTELVDGQINEISDVDIPAVPRATYKGQDLGKAILDEVDGEDEFVAVMVEDRGHEESEARRLFQYLTDIRDRDSSKAGDTVAKPFESPQGAEFEDCVETLTDGDLEREEAEAVCAAWQDDSKNKVDINGTEVDLTPPEPVVNAAEVALEAKRDRYPDVLGDCGSGVGEDRAERIIANDLRPEDFAGGENTAIPDYLDSHSEDVAGIDQPPTDWDESTWTDGCGPVQYALWGGTATGTGLEWANDTEQDVLDAMETERMADNDDGIDDATKLHVIKSWLTGSDDSATTGEAPGATKASDDDDDDEDEDDDEDDMENEKHAPDGETSESDMTEDTDTSDQPEWAKSLTESVEQIDNRVKELEDGGDGDDEGADKMDDAPEWAEDLAEKVDDLDDRVDAISKQSGHSQQLDGTETTDDGDGADEVEQFKKSLVGAGGN